MHGIQLRHTTSNTFQTRKRSSTGGDWTMKNPSHSVNIALLPQGQCCSLTSTESFPATNLSASPPALQANFFPFTCSLCLLSTAFVSHQQFLSLFYLQLSSFQVGDSIRQLWVSATPLHYHDGIKCTGTSNLVTAPHSLLQSSSRFIHCSSHQPILPAML